MSCAACGLPMHSRSSWASVPTCGGLARPHEAGSDPAFLLASHLLGRNLVSKGLEEGPGLWPALSRVCRVNGGQVPGAKQEPSSGLVWVGPMRATSWEPL